MSALKQKLTKYETAYEVHAEKFRPVECLWQIVRRDNDFIESMEDFSPVNRVKRPVKLPDSPEERIRLLNKGAVLLLGGVLRLFIIPDEVDIKKVEILFDGLSRKYGNNRAAMYQEAVKILFKESKNG